MHKRESTLKPQTSRQEIYLKIRQIKITKKTHLKQNFFVTLLRCVYTLRYLPCIAVFYHIQVQILSGHLVSNALQCTVNNAEYKWTFRVLHHRPTPFAWADRQMG